MSHITLTPATGLLTVTAGGVEIARSDRAVELREGSMPPRLYIPREDVAMDRLTRSATRTTCPYKGEASYYSTLDQADIAWSYETPNAGLDAIAGHFSFYDGKTATSRG